MNSSLNEEGEVGDHGHDHGAGGHDHVTSSSILIIYILKLGG